MTPASFRRQVLQQALGLLLCVALLAAAAIAARATPDGPDQLKIAAATLRSQSAELRWLSAEADRRLPPRFLQAHAQQLAKNIESSQQALEGLQPVPGLRPVQRALKPVAHELVAAARALQHDPREASETARQQTARTDALARVEQALTR